MEFKIYCFMQVCINNNLTKWKIGGPLYPIVSCKKEIHGCANLESRDSIHRIFFERRSICYLFLVFVET